MKGWIKAEARSTTLTESDGLRDFLSTFNARGDDVAFNNITTKQNDLPGDESWTREFDINKRMTTSRFTFPWQKNNHSVMSPPSSLPPLCF